MNIGIVCSCLPAVRALLKRDLHRLPKWTGSKSVFSSFRKQPTVTANSTSTHGNLAGTVSDAMNTKKESAVVQELQELRLDKPLPLTPIIQTYWHRGRGLVQEVRVIDETLTTNDLETAGR